MRRIIEAFSIIIIALAISLAIDSYWRVPEIIKIECELPRVLIANEMQFVYWHNTGITGYERRKKNTQKEHTEYLINHSIGISVCSHYRSRQHPLMVTKDKQ